MPVHKREPVTEENYSNLNSPPPVTIMVPVSSDLHKTLLEGCEYLGDVRGNRYTIEDFLWYLLFCWTGLRNAHFTYVLADNEQYEGIPVMEEPEDPSLDLDNNEDIEDATIIEP